MRQYRSHGLAPRNATIIVTGRFDAQALRKLADDDAWRGTELARQVAQPRSEALTPVELLTPPSPLPREAVQDFARRTFVPGRQVVVNFSPFAG